MSLLQSDWFFSDDEEKGERVSDERRGGVWSEVTPFSEGLVWVWQWREIVQRLRTPTVPAEDPNVVPSTHIQFSQPPPILELMMHPHTHPTSMGTKLKCTSPYSDTDNHAIKSKRGS